MCDPPRIDFPATYKFGPSPADIRHPSLHRLRDYWLSRHRNAAIPAWRDLDVLDITELWPHLLLVDICRDPFQLRYRLIGTALVAKAGHDDTGKTVEADYIGTDWETMKRAYAHVASSGKPLVRNADFVGSDVRHYASEQLFLPLSGDGRSVINVLSGMYFAPAEGPA